MKSFDIYFPEIKYSFSMVLVKGTGNKTYLFGAEERVSIHINDFLISKYPITQTLWNYITGNNPSQFNGQARPVECISFNDITQSNGFLDKLNSAAGKKFKLNADLVFRLPSETKWEYAARGGTQWTDKLQFSGSIDINDVGWYDQTVENITILKFYPD